MQRRDRFENQPLLGAAVGRTARGLQPANMPVQGTGADILKLAMIEVDKALKEKNLKSQMILQVHDELIFDVFEDELEEVMSLVKEKMENCIKMDVPLIVEGNYAKNWCELK